MADSKPTTSAAKAAKPATAKVVAKSAPVQPAAKVAAPQPVAAPVAKPVPEFPAAQPAVMQKEAETMNDTVNKIVEDTKTRAETAFGEFQTRAKAAVEKGQSNLSEVAEFNKGNGEAIVASARVAAKGAQDIAAYTVEYGKGAIEKAVADTRRLYAVKSPTEFFQVQSEIAKAAVDETVAQVSKFTENYLKLVGEVVQPLQNRYALAAEKAKTAFAA